MPDSFILTRFEYVELLSHLEAKPHFWMQSEEDPNVWLRSDAEGESHFLLQFVTSAETEGVVRLETVPVGWPAEKISVYLRGLLEHWTTFRIREAQVALLREAGLDASTSELLGVALSQVEVKPAEGLAPDLPELEPERVSSPDVGLFQILGGGYVRLEYRKDGFLQATLSIPSRRRQLSFGPPLIGLLQGVVRAHATHTSSLAHSIQTGDSE